MTNIQSAIDHVRAHRDYILSELKDLAAIPSISTLPETLPDIRRAAEYVAKVMRSMGMDSVAILPTQAHPVLFGEGPPGPALASFRPCSAGRRS